uniref:Cilia- and flagella-associated protein 263 n=1 Tax=Spongospora subterranea TaxID=70186 RepID=A0A0H5QX95_9EUKA|eukprot:CRZ06236.1 hypothetical protein [Spongospora subterranea]
MSVNAEIEDDEVKLEHALQQVMEQTDTLVKENEMFAAYLLRQNAKMGITTDEELGDVVSIRPLTQAQKLEIILLEEQAIAADIDDITERAQKDINSLKEVIEESTIRCNEIRKDAYELRRDLLINVDDPKSEISADKIIKYFQEKINAKQEQCDKLQAKNNSLKLQIQKCDLQIKQKSEQGENLHQIDFQQLQIENSQYNAKIQQRNKQLLKLKMTTGKTVQVLNNAKHDLSNLLNENSRLNRDSAERESQISKMVNELNRVVSDIEKAKRVHKKSEGKLNNTEMPHIFDYVQQMSEIQKLQAQMKTWQRKTEIAQIGAKTKKKQKFQKSLRDHADLKTNNKLKADEAERNAQYASTF